ncbi:PAS domain S-box protein [Silvimonas sp.]|uniref:PAS domain S-box protein n=1 Tax=Silvimonas sp. TaxID=2650811 RepID=UPI0028493FB8|nr:PAS domain S-box protein [Silvimonas sp.]MDR3429338.1 PAS domain S-box protein [Silvimonas sp.]
MAGLNQQSAEQLQEVSRRTSALLAYEVLDTPADPAFDDIARLAAQLCGVPMASISFCLPEREWFKAAIELPQRQLVAQDAFAPLVLDANAAVVVPDLAADPRFASHPWVSDAPQLQFYASVPLRIADGLAIGALAVYDTRPGNLSEQQASGLETLATQIMTLLTLRQTQAWQLSTEASRQKSAALNRLILDSATDFAIVSMDREGLITSWNTGAEKIMGWTEAEMRGQPAHVFFTPEEVANGVPEQEMAASLVSGRGEDDRWHMRKSGEQFWGAGLMMPLRGDMGEHLGFIKILRDRTQQRAMDEALRESAEFTTRLLDGSPDCIQVLDLAGNLTFINSSGLRLLDIQDAESVKSRHWADFWEGENQLKALNALAAAQAGKTTHFQGSTQAFSGRKWWEVVLTPVFDEQGQPEKILCIATDISQAHHTQQQLARSETRFAATFDQVPAGLCELTPQGAFTLVNDHLCALFGLTREALLQLTLADVLHPAELEMTLPQLSEAALGGSSFDAIKRYVRGDGEVLWANTSVSCIRSENGEPSSLLAVIVDSSEQKKSEERLLATNMQLETEGSRLKQLFSHTPSFMAILRGPDHVFEYFNSRCDELFKNRKLAGLPARLALPELAGQGVLDLLEQVYTTAQPFLGNQVPVTLNLPQSADQDGDADTQTHYLDFIFQPVADTDGKITSIFFEGNDVTDRVLATASARERENEMRTLAEALPNHAWSASPDGNLTWFNQRVYEYTGVEPGTLDDAGWEQVVHPEDRARSAEVWQNAVANGTPYEVEARIRRGVDDAYRWFLIRALPVRGELGEIRRWIGTNTDVDEQRVLTSQLAGLNATLGQQVEERTADRDRMWRLSVHPMMVAQYDGMILDVNPAWTNLLGWSAEKVRGRFFPQLLHAESRADAQLRISQVQSGLIVNEFEVQVAHEDGSYRLISWTAVGEGDRIHAIGHDVTAERLAQEALRSSEEALRQSQKMEAVGQLTGGIAHDFNNLLQGITGSLSMAKRRAGQARYDDLGRLIDNAVASANRAAALTHRLLAFSRRQPLDPKALAVDELIRSMEDLWRRTLGESIELDLVFGEALWPALCDENQLENALLNLIINARDAMPDGGQLEVQARNIEIDSVVAARSLDMKAGQYVCISVSDTGTGMAPDVIKRAFDPFFTTKPLGEGTGLGLSMIYGFVRQSNGHVNISSTVGKGTTLSLYLPRGTLASTESAENMEISATPTAGHEETVLVVEDEALVRELIVEVLSELGYVSLQAGDGPSGLAILQSSARIDLLVTDIGLPILNGRQIADAARLIRPGLKVLFMTGYAENTTMASGFLEAGMEMITKPFAMETLANRIRKLIESPAS